MYYFFDLKENLECKFFFLGVIKYSYIKFKFYLNFYLVVIKDLKNFVCFYSFKDLEILFISFMMFKILNFLK